MTNPPMTSEESAHFIDNLESTDFSINEWEIYQKSGIPTTEYNQLLEDCDPRHKPNDRYFKYAGFFPEI